LGKESVAIPRLALGFILALKFELGRRMNEGDGRVGRLPPNTWELASVTLDAVYDPPEQKGVLLRLSPGCVQRPGQTKEEAELEHSVVFLLPVETAQSLARLIAAKVSELSQNPRGQQSLN
jgi:hypothetical protein